MLQPNSNGLQPDSDGLMLPRLIQEKVVKLAERPGIHEEDMICRLQVEAFAFQKRTHQRKTRLQIGHDTQLKHWVWTKHLGKR